MKKEKKQFKWVTEVDPKAELTNLAVHGERWPFSGSKAAVGRQAWDKSLDGQIVGGFRIIAASSLEAANHGAENARDGVAAQVVNYTISPRSEATPDELKWAIIERV